MCGRGQAVTAVAPILQGQALALCRIIHVNADARCRGGPAGTWPYRLPDEALRRSREKNRSHPAMDRSASRGPGAVGSVRADAARTRALQADAAPRASRRAPLPRARGKRV
jgi:hypothetical protein